NTKDKIPSTKDQQIMNQKIKDSVNTKYKNDVVSVISQNLKLASSVSPRNKQIKKILADAETSIAKAPRPMVNHLVAALIALNRMCEDSVDISDLTITR